MRGAALFAALVGLAEASGTSPVSKVVELLEGMEKDLESEGTADKGTQDKMDCWCKQTKEEAQKDIDEANATITSSTAEIESQTKRAGKAEQEAAAAEKTSQESTKKLEDATAAREKAQADFHEDEKDLVQSISALESAVTVLSKHHSFLQSGASMGSVAKTLSSQLSKYQAKHEGEISPMQRERLESFIQQPSFAGYQSQSGEIFGILNNMLDTFKADLDESRKEEAESQKTYGIAKKNLQDLIRMSNKRYKEEKTKAGNAKKAAAEAEAAKASAEDALEKSTTLLADTTETCQNSVADFTARAEVREQEKVAVAKALEYLNSEEAHALFNDTFNFMQLASKTESRAAVVLRHASSQFGNRKMLSLAQAIKEGTFDKVIHAIDDLVKDLEESMAKDVSDKDSCVKDINDKKADLAKLNNEIAKNEAKKQRLEAQEETLTNQMETLRTEIEELNTELKKMGQIREESNSEFQKVAANQAATVKVLTQAHTVLKNVYGSKSFLQQQPAAFQDEGKHAGGQGVLDMIENIKADCEKELALATQDENNAQKAYEKQVRASNDLITNKENDFEEKKGQRAECRTKLTNTNNELGAPAAEEPAVGQYQDRQSQELNLKAKEAECDFLLKNFDIRAEHMQGEKEALQQAKAFLQGMK